MTKTTHLYLENGVLMVGLLFWSPTAGIRYISFILEVPCLFLGGSWCDVKPQMLLSQINTSLCLVLLLEMKQTKQHKSFSQNVTGYQHSKRL